MPIIGGATAGVGFGGVLFDQTVTGSTTTTIDTGTVITAGKRLVRAFLTSRTDQAALTTDLQFTVNGDTAAHYDRVFMGGANANFYQADVDTGNTSWLIDCPGNTDPDPLSTSLITLDLHAYDTTSFWKTVFATESRCSTVAGDNGIISEGWRWRSTAAINRITVYTGSASVHFIAGSRLTVLAW